MLSRVRRLAGLVTTVVVFFVLAGATYQGVATSLERRDFQRPGGLGDVGGFQLHIYCVGTGSPTVVLEAAAGSLSAAWGQVQEDVARMTRVCSYDRDGLGWSETRDGRYEPSRVPAELRALLEEAHEPAPFVLAGHELGAAFARAFAATYPRDAAALVLIDDPITGGRSSPLPPMPGAWPWLARTGLLRATGSLSRHANGLPGKAGGAMRAFLNRPDHLTRAATEISRREEVEAAVRTLQLDPSVAVVEVATSAAGTPAMIVTDEDTARVTAALEAAVTRVRQARAKSSLEQ
ncbi:MAG TPA: alpha/beta hydrolase [Vicinamibacterales bacterium]|nr:alpha/beta hydrolase [Vicinamibacterales bacterium]